MNNKISKKEIEKDLSRFKKFEVMANSEGGQEFKKLCLQDIVNAVDILATKFQTLNHIELVAQCAILKERLTTYRLLKNSKENVILASEALQEALDQENTD